MTDWWNVYEDVLNLAKWLHSNGHFDKHDPKSVQHLLDFFEEPWKWEPEWNKMQDENMKEVAEKVQSATKMIEEALEN